MNEKLQQLGDIQALLEQDENEKNGKGAEGAEGGSEKIILTPDVREYAEKGLRAVQGKLRNDERLYEKDFEFVAKVKNWMEFPSSWRKYGLEIYAEINKALIELGRLKGEVNPQKWVEENFEIKNGKILCEGDLDLEGCTGLRELPAGLSVGGYLYLEGCTGLRELPAGLSVGGFLDLEGCTGLRELQAGLSVNGDLDLSNCTGLRELPAGLSVGGDLDLSNCTGLRALPAGLSVRGYLDLVFCIGLRKLPAGLSVGGGLDLRGCNESVIEDAHRLQAEGKIKREIKFD